MVTNQMLKYKNNPSMMTAEQIFMKLHRNTKQKQVQCKLKKIGISWTNTIAIKEQKRWFLKKNSTKLHVRYDCKTCIIYTYIFILCSNLQHLSLITYRFVLLEVAQVMKDSYRLTMLVNGEQFVMMISTVQLHRLFVINLE